MIATDGSLNLLRKEMQHLTSGVIIIIIIIAGIIITGSLILRELFKIIDLFERLISEKNKGNNVMPELFMTFVIGYTIVTIVAALWWIALMKMSD